jgi:hypothetical protein
MKTYLIEFAGRDSSRRHFSQAMPSAEDGGINPALQNLSSRLSSRLRAFAALLTI